MKYLIMPNDQANDICGSFSVCFPASCGNDCSSQSPCVKCPSYCSSNCRNNCQSKGTCESWCATLMVCDPNRVGYSPASY